MADPVTPTPPRVTCITHGVFELPTSTGEPIIFTVPAGYMLYIGEIAPTASVGNPGDWYVFANSGIVYRKINPTTWSVIATWGGSGGGGSVTSVAATVPSFLSVSGSPITASGTLAIDYSGTPLPVANGGTGTSSPGINAGANIAVSGTWPNQTVSASGVALGDNISDNVDQVAHGFSVGQAIFNAGGWAKAKADSASTSTVIGVVSAVADADNFTVVYSGSITLSGLTPGVYYLSASTAGLLTQTPPVGLTEFLVPILYAASATQAYVIQGFPSSLATVDIADGGTGAINVEGAWVNLNVTTNVIPTTVIDWSLGPQHSQTLPSNRTFTFSNAVDGQEIRVALTNTASNWTVTWPTVLWTSGTPPTQTVGAKTDLYRFSKFGSVILGTYDQNLS